MLDRGREPKPVHHVNDDTGADFAGNYERLLLGQALHRTNLR
jgi:hypothetical protein